MEKVITRFNDGVGLAPENVSHFGVIALRVLNANRAKDDNARYRTRRSRAVIIGKPILIIQNHANGASIVCFGSIVNLSAG